MENEGHKTNATNDQIPTMNGGRRNEQNYAVAEKQQSVIAAAEVVKRGVAPTPLRKEGEAPSLKKHWTG